MPSNGPNGFAFFDPAPMILGMLTRGPRHGYQLYQEYQRSLSEIWDLGLSRLYAVLNDLREQGAVQVEVVPQADRPPKKLHRLTPSGEAAFQKWVHQPVVPLRSVRVAFLAKLRMIQLLGLDGGRELIQSQIEVCQRVEQQAADAPGAASKSLIQSYRQAQASFLADWLKTVQQQEWPSGAEG